MTAQRPLWTVEEIKQAIGAQWLSQATESKPIFNVCYYRSQIQAGDLVFTTSPQHWEQKYGTSHDDLPKMFKNGASLVITDYPAANCTNCGPVLLVDNTRRALDALATAARARFKGKTICVTGSVGKSTTTKTLAHVLAKQASTIASRKNFNHAPGVSLTLAQTPADNAYGVYEFCVDLPDRTLNKALIAQPDVAVVTTIQPDHMYLYPTLEAIADQKSLLFRGLTERGVAVLNRDIPYYFRLRAAALRAGAKSIISFGKHAHADVCLLERTLHQHKSYVRINVQGQLIDYELNQPGEHNVMNSVAVLASVLALGADVERAAYDLRSMRHLAHHLTRFTIDCEQGSMDIIDDTFSANPASIKAAIEYLSLLEVRNQGCKRLILSDIHELGAASAMCHAQLSEPIIQNDIDKVYALGPDMKHLCHALPNDKIACQTEDPQVLIEAIARDCGDGDVILIKGSRRSADTMKQIVDYFKNCQLPTLKNADEHADRNASCEYEWR